MSNNTGVRDTTIKRLLLLTLCAVLLPALLANGVLTTDKLTLPDLATKTYQVGPEKQIPPPSNTFDDFLDGVEPTYYFVTTNASKAGTTSLTYGAKTYTVEKTYVMSEYATIDAAVKAAIAALGPDPSIAAVNAAITATTKNYTTFLQLPPGRGLPLPANTTWFFDSGEYWDNSGYTQFSNTNLSLVGLNATPQSTDRNAIFRRVPNPAVAVLNKVERHQLYNTPDIYVGNIVFDGNGYDMLPESPLYPQTGSKSRGEALIFVGAGSANLVMSNVEIRNVGKPQLNPDTGETINPVESSWRPATHNKNIGLEVFQAYNDNIANDTDGPKYFLDVYVHDVRSTYYGTVFTNKSNNLYFQNLQVDVAAGNQTALGTHGVRIENSDTPAGYLLTGNGATFYGNNTKIYNSAGTGDPKSAADFIQVQEYAYNDISAPVDYRFVEYRSRPYNYANIGSYRIWKDFRAPYTPHTDYTVGTAILDRQDNYWIVTDNNPNATITQQLNFIQTVRSNTRNALGGLAADRIPPVNIKLLADADNVLNGTFTVPDFGVNTPVNIILLKDKDTLYTSEEFIPVQAGLTINLGPRPEQVKLYNFDFDEKALYTLQEAISGTSNDPNDPRYFAVTDGYDNQYTNTDDNLLSADSYRTTTSARVTGSTINSFANCKFTELVKTLQSTQPAELTLLQGKTLDLNVSADQLYTNAAIPTGATSDQAADARLYYLSEDETIATVTDGIVTAKAPGTTIIRVKAIDANNQGEIEKPYARFKVTVIETTNLTGTKVWDTTAFEAYLGADVRRQPQTLYYTDTWLQLLRSTQGASVTEKVGEPVHLPAGPGNTLGTTSHTWENMPTTDPDGNEYTYTIDEVKNVGTAARPNWVSFTPTNTTKTVEGMTLTNTFFPIQDGVIKDAPCALEWYAEAFTSSTDEGYPNNNYTWKVNKDYFAHHKGSMEVQHFRFGTDRLNYRVPVFTDYEVKNAKLVLSIPQKEDGAAWEIDENFVTSFNSYWTTRFLHAGNRGIVSSHVDLVNPEVTATSITFNIGDLPANSSFLIEVRSTSMTVNPADNYYLAATLTGEYNCVEVEKAWTDGNIPHPDVTLRLVPNAQNYSLEAIQAFLGAEDLTFPVRREVRSEKARLNMRYWDANVVDLFEWAQGVTRRYPAAGFLMHEELGRLWQEATWTPVTLTAEQAYKTVIQPGDIPYNITAVEDAEITISAAYLAGLAQQLYDGYAATLVSPETSYVFGHLSSYRDAQDNVLPYSLTEDPVPGYLQVGEVVSSTNAAGKPKLTITNAPSIDVTATKTWANLDQATANHFLQQYAGGHDSINPYMDVWFKLYASENGGDPEAVDAPIQRVPFPLDAQGAAMAPPYSQTVTWNGLPKTDAAGNEIVYSVQEVTSTGLPLTLGQFTREEDGLKVTNTFFPVKDGVKVDDPCQFEWYAEAIADNSSKDWTNQNWTYKVNSYYFPEHKGQMEIQHFGALTWRIPVSTDYAMENTQLVIHLKDAMVLGWEPKIEVDNEGNVTSGINFESQYHHDMYNHNGLGGLTTKIIDKTDAPAVYNETDKTITITTGSLPANGGFLLNIVGTPTDKTRGIRYTLGATFTGEYNCLKTVKVWQGGEAPRPDITFRLLQNGVPVTQDSVLQALYQAAGGNVGDDLTFPIVKRDTIHNQALVLPGTVYAWAQELMLKYPQISPLIQNELVGLWQNANENGQWEPGEPVNDYFPGQNRPIPTLKTTFTLKAAFLEELARQIGERYVVTLPDGQTEHVWGNLSYQDAQGNPLVYTIEEVTVPGYSSSMVVEDIEDSTRVRSKRLITVTNVANPPTSAQLTITAKKLYNAALAGDDFTFQLLDAAGKVLQDGIKNKQDGTITFQPVVFEAEAEGVVLQVVEVKGSAEGVTYDSATYKLTYDVTLGDNNTLSAELVKLEKDGTALAATEAVTFTNSYTEPIPPGPTAAPTAVPTAPPGPTAAPTAAPKPTYPTLEVPVAARKVLKNGVLSAGQFTFVLKDAKGKVLAEVGNLKDGTVVFPSRTFSNPVQNYQYTITEKRGADEKVTYDATVYTLKITTTPVSGKLTAKVDVLKDGTPYAGDIVFTNVRKVPKTGDSTMQTVALLALSAVVLLGGALLVQRRKTESR